MKKVLNLALSHLRAGDEVMAFKVASNLADAPQTKKECLNWLYSLAAFDEAVSA